MHWAKHYCTSIWSHYGSSSKNIKWSFSEKSAEFFKCVCIVRNTFTTKIHSRYVKGCRFENVGDLMTRNRLSFSKATTVLNISWTLHWPYFKSDFKTLHANLPTIPKYVHQMRNVFLLYMLIFMTCYVCGSKTIGGTGLFKQKGFPATRMLMNFDCYPHHLENIYIAKWI